MKVLFSEFNLFVGLPWSEHWMPFRMWRWCCLCSSMLQLGFLNRNPLLGILWYREVRFWKHIPNLIREYVKCENNCPCYDNCFDGCPCSYETEYCDIPDECKVDEKNTAEFGKCDQFNRSQFLYCTDNCEIYDTDCFHDCSVNFEEGNEARIVNTSVWMFALMIV